MLQHAGPLGGPGMPEWGMLPIPKKLLQAGVRDMVRISDARMSGTSYGTCVLHVAPESFVGGPLAFVRDGDLIELNVPERRLTLRVSDDELATRREGMGRPGRAVPAGYGKLHAQHVLQADRDATSTSCRRGSDSRAGDPLGHNHEGRELQFGHCDRHCAGLKPVRTEAFMDIRSIVSSTA